jgi:hypothetical protein
VRQQAITIHKPTFGTDNYGNEAVTGYTNVAARGRVRPTSAREVTSEGQRMLVDAVGYVEASSNVSETDEVTAGGKRYRVLGVFLVESETGYLTHWHCDLQAVS